MITPATNTSLSQDGKRMADDMAHSAERAIDATRSQANHLLDSAESKVDYMRSKAEPALEKFAAKAQDLAQRGLDMASHTKDQAKETLSNYSAVTTRYVADKPMQSILIAAAVGAAVALLVSSNRGRDYR